MARNGLVNWKVYTEDKEDNKKLIEVKDKNDPKFKENSNIIDPTVFPDDIETMKNLYKTGSNNQLVDMNSPRGKIAH